MRLYCLFIWYLFIWWQISNDSHSSFIRIHSWISQTKKLGQDKLNSTNKWIDTFNNSLQLIAIAIPSSRSICLDPVHDPSDPDSKGSISRAVGITSWGTAKVDSNLCLPRYKHLQVSYSMKRISNSDLPFSSKNTGEPESPWHPCLSAPSPV